MRIYLCGGIKKTKDDKKIVWSEEDKEVIRKVIPRVEFLDPQRVPESYDPMMAFGCDIKDVNDADVIMADLRQKRGIGVGAEMAMAKVWNKPMVSVCPENSHFRRDIELNGKRAKGWVHPFMACLSDHVAESVHEAAVWVRDLNGDTKIKGPEIVKDAIEYFKKSGEKRK